MEKRLDVPTLKRTSRDNINKIIENSPETMNVEGEYEPEPRKMKGIVHYVLIYLN